MAPRQCYESDTTYKHWERIARSLHIFIEARAQIIVLVVLSTNLFWKIQALRFHRDVAVGYEQQVRALEAEKDRDWRRSSHEIDYLNKAIKQLRNAEERYMAEEEDDATKTEELKRQLAGVKNELQARTGVVVVLGT